MGDVIERLRRLLLKHGAIPVIEHEDGVVTVKFPDGRWHRYRVDLGEVSGIHSCSGEDEEEAFTAIPWYAMRLALNRVLMSVTEGHPVVAYVEDGEEVDEISPFPELADEEVEFYTFIVGAAEAGFGEFYAEAAEAKGFGDGFRYFKEIL